jgi:hypothetical protein
MHDNREMGRGPGSPSQAVGTPMAMIQAAIFWIMVALTPSMILVAVLLLRAEICDYPESDFNSSQKLEFDD